jgi:hypothetical protein
VTTIVLVEKSDGALPPVHLRVDSLQPRHAQNGIVILEGEGDEVERIRVRSDANRSRLHDAARGLLAAVGQGDEVRPRQRCRGKVVSVYERRRDEVAGGAAVE